MKVNPKHIFTIGIDSSNLINSCNSSGRRNPLHDMLIIFGKFIICTILIVTSGYYLSLMADNIADKKGISKTWIGIILLSTITSLPELVTSIAALETPDLAMGNIFGSNTINMVIIAIMDFISKERPLLEIVDIGHVLNAGFCLLATSITMFAMILRLRFPDSLSIANVGIESFLIIAVYIIGMKGIFLYESEKSMVSSPINSSSMFSKDVSLVKEYVVIVISSVVVMITGVWLAQIGGEIVEVTGWGTSFVGFIFLAITTSLPELVVCLSAVKLQSFDMGVGNMLGSCLFNIAIIPVLDIVYRKNILFSAVSQDHILPAILSVILTSIIVIGIIFRSKKSSKLVSYELWMVVICYLIGAFILFKTALPA